MKFALYSAFIAFALSTLPSFAHADDHDVCGPVFQACEGQGYARDQEAAPGKKIWADCADLIINKKKTVANVTVDPKDVKKCRKFKKAKAEFEKNWNQKNQ
jgi:hypothetical protein